MKRRFGRALLAAATLTTALAYVLGTAQPASAVGTSALTHGELTMVSTHVDGSGGPTSNGSTSQVSIASDGSAVAFTSTVPAPDLVTDPAQIGSVTDTNGTDDVFVYLKGPGPAPSTISLVSWNDAHSGTGDFASYSPIFAPSPVPTQGTVLPLGLVFTTDATNLSATAAPANQHHIFAWTLVSDVVKLVLIDNLANSSSTVSSGIAHDPSISMFPSPTVVFESNAPDLISPPMASGSGDQVWAHDLVTGKNVLVSHTVEGPTHGAIGGADEAMIAGNAPIVVFSSNGNDFTGTLPSNGFNPLGTDIWQVTLKPAGAGTLSTALVSTDAGGGTRGTTGNHDPVISILGNSVAWMSNDAANSSIPFDPAQSGQREHVFFRSQLGTTQMIDVHNGVGCDENSNNPGLSGDGSLVVFESGCTNLASAVDENNVAIPENTNVFQRRMTPALDAPDLLPDAAPVLVSGRGGSTTYPSANGGVLCTSNDFECLGNPSVTVDFDGTAIAFTGGFDIAPLSGAYQGNLFVRYGGPSAHTINATTSNAGTNPHGSSVSPRITGDGAFAAFVSFADDLVPDLPPSDPQKIDANGAGDAFFADLRNTYLITPLTTVTEGTDTEAVITVTRQGPFGGAPGTADVIRYTPGDGMAPSTPLPSEITDVGATDATGFEVGDPPGLDDYVISDGTLVFPPGVSTRTFSVPIGDNATAEGPEFFHVTISAELGAQKDLVPGPASSGYVLILDDDAPPQSWHVNISTPPPATAQVGDVVSVGYTVSVDAGADDTSVSSVASGGGTAGLDSATFPSPPTTVTAGTTSAESTATARVVATPGTAGVHLQIEVTGTLGAVGSTKTANTSAITVAEAVTATLSGAPATVDLPDQITYTLTLTNASDTAAELTGLPAGLATPAGASGGTASGAASVAANSATAWTLTVDVDDADVNGATITQTPTGVAYAMSSLSLAARPVTVTPTSQSSTVHAPIVAVGPHTLTDVNGGSLLPNDAVAVSVTVANTGAGATTATLTDALTDLASPTGIEIDGTPCGACSSTASSVTAPLGTLAAAGSHVVTFTATVPASPGGTTASSSATVAFSPATTATSPTTANIASLTIDSVPPAQDWSVAITQQPPSSANVGDTVTVKATISVEAGAANLAVTALGIGAGTSGLDSATYLDTPPFTVNAGATREVTLTARVVATPGAAGVHLQVAVTGALANGSEVRTDDTDAIASSEAVTATLAGGPATLGVADQITYTLTFTNASDTPAQLSGLPAGLAAPSGTTGGPATGAATVAANSSTAWMLVVDVDDADDDGAVITQTPSGVAYAMSALSLAARPVAVSPTSVSSSVEVAAVNHPPVADGDLVITTDDGPVTFDLVATDPDGDPLTFEIVMDVAHGTLVCTPQGHCTYTPEDGYVGDDSLQFTVSDGQVEATATSVRGAATGDPTTVLIHVTAPTATTSTTTPDESTPTTAGDASGSGTGGSELPHTGSGASLPLAAVGLAVLALGALLATVAKRNRPHPGRHFTA